MTFVTSAQVTIPLTATDVATGGTFPVIVTNPAPGGGSSNTVNFTVIGAAAKLAFGQQPTNTAAGASITPAVTVQVEDAGGNVVTSNTDPVTIAIQATPRFRRAAELSAKDRTVLVTVETAGEPLPVVAEDAGVIPAARLSLRTRGRGKVRADLLEQLGLATGPDRRPDGLPKSLSLDRVQPGPCRLGLRSVGRPRGRHTR